MSMVILLAMLAIQVISLIGLYYLTQFAFNSERGTGDERKLNLSNATLNATKVTVVLQWIMIGVTVLGIMYNRY